MNNFVVLMVKIIREDYYFSEPGEENTNDVIEAVAKRVRDTGIANVVVASHTGTTALRFAEALKGKAKIICVSTRPERRDDGKKWPSIDKEVLEKLESLGVVSVYETPYAMESSVVEKAKWGIVTPDRIVRETLYAFGQGMKVAVQVALMSVSCGRLDPYQDVIAVGGTGKGADTAIIVKAVYPISIFAEEPERRLEIREVIAMPRRKEF